MGRSLLLPRFWATVCKTVRHILSDRCLSVLSVCNVAVLWPNGWIRNFRMPLGTDVGLGPGHIVLDGDPARPKEAQPPIFGPCLLWPNVWMDQDTTSYEGRPGPKLHCVMGTQLPLPKSGLSPPPQFSAHVYCGQTVAHLSYC